MKINKASIILPLALFAFSGALTAVQADNTQLTPVQIGPIQGTIVKSVDPAVLSITASACKCDLRDVNALYMKGVKAKMFNHQQGNAKVDLKLSWYSLVNGATKTVFRRNVSVPGRRHTTFHIISGPILAKRNVGVTVEIVSSIPADSVTTNNKLTVQDCATYVVE